MKNLLLLISIRFFVAGTIALGQGSVLLDNSTTTNRVSIDMQGNLYNGTFGMEVWQINSTNPSLAGVLDMTAATNSLMAYTMLAANGFRLEGTFVSQTMVGGVFQINGIEMGGVRPPGGTVTLVLAAWNGSAVSWNSAVGEGANAGLIGFIQPTSNYNLVPPEYPELLNWTVPQDLVMLPTIPEPGCVALGCLGAAILIFRRHRR